MCRVEELQEALKAATEVNRHLASEVERLTLENDSLVGHLRVLRKQLKPGAGTGPSKPDPSSQPAGCTDPLGLHLNQDSNEQVEAVNPLEALTEAAWEDLARRARSLGWLIDPLHVQLGPVVGFGSFGTTRKGVWRGADCAVKEVRAADGHTENFAREVVALSLIRHPNVVALYGAVINPPSQFWLVCEWLPNGTLASWLHGLPGGRRPDRSLLARLRMALDVACGMEALEQHDPPIVHRDLKPGNVMIDATGRAKVADMGLARVLTHDALMSLTPETGSYLYMAPEVVRHELYATQADVWSWACLVSELLTGFKPYEERHLTPVQVALAVANGAIRPAVPAMCPPGVAEILVAALDQNPIERPSFAVVVAVMRRVVEEESARHGNTLDKEPIGRWKSWWRQTG